MKNNTIVTIGDINYLWGIFMMIASLRKNGMDEPVLVGTQRFTPEAEAILRQLGDVSFYSLDGVPQSLTCLKAEVMLQAKTEYITWVDSDGFFTGNCSELLPPKSPEEIHVRMRSEIDHPSAFRNYLEAGEDGRTIPPHILKVWQRDVNDLTSPRNPRACAACFLSVHESARPFLEKWDLHMKTFLPATNVGVVDRSLIYYHQLDESVLNSLLCFSSLAPRVCDTFLMDKDRARLFVHFIGMPKPWQGWAPHSIRHFDTYTEVASWALAQKFQLPTKLPFALGASHRVICKLLAHPVNFYHRVKRFVRRKLK